MRTSTTLARTRAVAVVGGGYTGTTAVLCLLRSIMRDGQAGPFSKLKIVWIDTADFGRGLPYIRQAEGENEPFILNQPVYTMSPFDDQPDLYSDWLAKNTPQYNDLSFPPRSLYGRFLQELMTEYEQRAENAGLQVSIIRLRAKAVDMSLTEDELHVMVEPGDGPLRCDAALVCTGHERADGFGALKGWGGYIADPYRVSSYAKAMSNLDGSDSDDAIVIGSGSSSLDAIRALEHVGFTGRYSVVSSSAAEPYVWDPALYKRLRASSYKPQFLTPESTEGVTDYETLVSLLEKELLFAAENGYGRLHVFVGCDPQKLFTQQAMLNQAVQRFVHLLFQHRRAVTSPESMELMQRLEKQGRLERIHARASVEQVTQQGRTFVLRGATLSENKPFECRGALFVNCAQILHCYKQPLPNKFIDNLCKRQLLQMTENGLLERISDLPIRALGPMTETPGGGPRYGWSARLFREEIRMAVEDTLVQMQGIAPKPAKLSASQSK